MRKETWEFINSFAPWLSAIGTIAAVIVSLYFSKKDKLIKLRINVGTRIIITPGLIDKIQPQVINISITNIGYRKVTVKLVGGRLGIFKKKAFIINILPTINSQSLPATLEESEDIQLNIPLNQNDWIRDFANGHLSKSPFFLTTSLRFIAYTSVGKNFQCKPEKGFKSQLLQEARKAKRNAKAKEF